MAAAFSALFSPLAHSDPLKDGDKAPDVTAVTEAGDKLSFGDFYKKQTYTLVYFFPKADTPGCTAQGCSLRDAYADLQAKGVAVIGVSLDSVEAQKAFKDKYHFPFTLIADTDKTVIGAFGVPLMPMRALATRQAYLIKDGVVIWHDYKAATKEQAADVLKVLAEQKG